MGEERAPADAVWQIGGEAGEGLAVAEPVAGPWPVAEWLALVERAALRLRVLPVSLLAGSGVAVGGHVLLGEAYADRVYFALAPGAIPALVGHLPDEEFAELVRRTPALGDPGAAR